MPDSLGRWAVALEQRHETRWLVIEREDGGADYSRMRILRMKRRRRMRMMLKDDEEEEENEEKGDDGDLMCFDFTFYSQQG
jgi:hypothetical protein